MAIAHSVRISRDALNRHLASHLPASLVASKSVRDLASAESLGAELERLAKEARRLGQKAERGGDVKTALLAVRECARIADTVAKVTGIIGGSPGAGPTTNNYVLVFEGGVPKSRPAIEATVVDGHRVGSPEPLQKPQQITAGVPDGCPTSEDSE